MANRNVAFGEDQQSDADAQERLIALLAEARAAAETRNRPVWDFAVELPSLIDAGATLTLLRSLVCDSVVEHAQEITSLKHQKRRFRPVKSLWFTAATCFVLSENAAQHSSTLSEATSHRPPHPHTHAQRTANPRPHWDRDARTLSVNGRIIKRFRVPAKCQEIILNVLEEMGWPPYIDDPLPPSDGDDPKYRLHNTIKALNGHHAVPLLRFTGNGTGCGVHWEFIGKTEGARLRSKIQRSDNRKQACASD